MDRLSFEHCYLINLFNVSVENLSQIHPARQVNLNGIKFGTNLRITNKHAAVISKTTCLG